MQNSREEWTALVIPVYIPGLEDDPFEQQLEKVHFEVSEVPSEIKGKPWASIISDIIFGADFPPRFLILVADQEWILVDRFKWPNNRVLRFQWNEILDRRDNATHQASASLLHSDQLSPESGESLLESLDRERPQTRL